MQVFSFNKGENQKFKLEPVKKVTSVFVAGANSVNVGQSTKLTATVAPSDASNKAVTWKSSNTAVATVDANGNVKGVKAGSATITATAQDGSGKAGSKTVTVAAVVAPKPTQAPVAGCQSGATKQMFRMYNRISHEHLYTADPNERDTLKKGDWVYEGIGWVAPASSKTPVHRLYNPALGDHHYTTDANEVNVLTSQHGWRYEGVGWYSDDCRNVPVYRQVTPLLRVGSHNYTADKNEYDTNNRTGVWQAEGVAWYAVARQ